MMGCLIGFYIFKPQIFISYVCCCLCENLLCALQKFYMIGRDKNRTFWRVLKIDRSEPSELNIHDDATTYSEGECNELLKRIDEGNRSTGGLKFVTNCYGIIGKLIISLLFMLFSFNKINCHFRICEILGALLYAAYH